MLEFNMVFELHKKEWLKYVYFRLILILLTLQWMNTYFGNELTKNNRNMIKDNYLKSKNEWKKMRDI